MTREDIHKLVAGYATGTLTKEERQVLFAAALEDQELFDQLAREQELKELLDEPGVRERLIASLDPPQRRAWFGAWRGRWSRSGTAMAAASVAAAILLGVYLSQPTEPKKLAVNLPPPSPISPAPFVPAPPESSPAPPLPAPAAVERARRRGTPALPPPAAANEVDQVSADKRATNAPQQQAAVSAAAPVAPPPLPGPVPPSAPKPAAVAAPKPAALDAEQLAQLPALQIGGQGGQIGGRGGGRGGRAAVAGTLAQNQFAQKAAAAPVFGFVYSVTADRGLRIVPASNGFLSVSAADQILVSNRALTAASSTEVPLPAGATSANVVFSAQQITDSVLNIVARRQDAASGTVSDANAGPSPRLDVVIPIPPPPQ